MERDREKFENTEAATPLEIPTGADSKQPTNPSASHEEIAQRAYRRFEERGSEHGHDLEDWLEAEREVGGRTGE